MALLDDQPIGSEPRPASPPPRGGESWRVWAFVALGILIVAVVAALIYLRRSPESAPPPESAVTGTEQAVPAARGPLGPAVEPRELPPIDQMDTLVRELLRALSSRPELAAWLATDGLVRNIVASVDAIANGVTPRSQLRRLAPRAPFTPQQRGEEAFVIDPRSYARYDGIGDTVAAIDADGLARAYVTLRPRLQEAYRELGYPQGNFDDAVERAIVRLLNTPVLEGDVRVMPAPVLFKFVDARIEGLTGVQKQLLRMGPRNTRIVHAKLRDVARALGIPAERLASRPN